MINRFDREYINLCNTVLNDGHWLYNERTGKKCLKIHGHMMKFDLSDGTFPLLTLRKMFTNGMIGELLGFIRGFDNAADFRKLGCNFWDENANATEAWLNNPNRKGTDDLGRIYGVQARDWIGSEKYFAVGEHPQDVHIWIPTYDGGVYNPHIDQLKNVIDKISAGIDDRRLIVTHMNPGEVDRMALPPCHMMYQFGLRGDVLDLGMYQRSADIPLGVPTNIASYALLLLLVARITGKTPGMFTHFLWDTHFYEDQMPGIMKLLALDGFEAPRVTINPEIKTLQDLETWVTPEDIKIVGYHHGPVIKYPFAK
jgi:thymidylate synthase